jgi:hypothetical protein
VAADKRPTVEPYPFTPAFERAVVWLACTSPVFYGSTAHVLEPDAFASEAARLAVSAAHAIARDIGRGPASALLVVQRLRRMVDDGKITFEQMGAVSDFLDAAEDSKRSSTESITAEVSPILQRRAQMRAIVTATDKFASHGDFTKVTDMLQQAAQIGIADTTGGVLIGAGSFSSIERIRHATRCPCGIADLDDALDGGMARGQLGFFIGGSGAGKSMALAHAAGTALRLGMTVGVVTLELAEPYWLARIKANLTDLPINAILDGSMEEAKRRLMTMKLGIGILKEMTPHVTTVDDIKQWVRFEEERMGRPMDVLIVDYADKLTAPKKVGGAEHGEYQAMRVVYEGLRVYAIETGKWVWTASQASRPKRGDADVLDLQHVSDSMHKVRSADLVITLNPGDDGMRYFVAKNRTGRGRFTVGPLPIEFATARMAPVSVQTW